MAKEIARWYYKEQIGSRLNSSHPTEPMTLGAIMQMGEKKLRGTTTNLPHNTQERPHRGRGRRHGAILPEVRKTRKTCSIAALQGAQQGRKALMKRKGGHACTVHNERHTRHHSATELQIAPHKPLSPHGGSSESQISTWGSDTPHAQPRLKTSVRVCSQEPASFP